MSEVPSKRDTSGSSRVLYTRGDRPSYPIESVDNALALLMLFRDRAELRVAEVSEVIGVARSTAHRLLAMLQWHGFIVQDTKSKVYRTGPSLVELGAAALGQLDIRAQARPFLEELHDHFNETVHLVLPRGRAVLFIDAIESTRHPRVSERVGGRLPAHCTSVGKALLADLSDAAICDLYPDEKLEDSLTDDSLTLHGALLAEIERFRSRGYATNIGESEVGVGSVGASIVGSDGPIAAVSIAAPTSRLSDDRVAELAQAIVDAASRMASRLRL